MKNTRAIIMIVLSLLAGVAAVAFGARWLGEQASFATSGVVVAARDIELGSVLNASMLQVVTWPSGSMPSGASSDVKALETRVVKVSVTRGEPVLEGKLAPVGTKGGLSAVIGTGKRAITVRVNEVVGVAGFALPGNYVDVMVNTQDEKDKPISKIVLEKILVLAVAQEAGRDETKPKVVNAVTLEVDPQQAEKLDLARSIGSLSLVLRNQVEMVGTTPTAGARKADLLGLKGPTPVVALAGPKPASKPVPRRAPAAVPQVEKDRVEVIRGVQRSNAQL